MVEPPLSCYGHAQKIMQGFLSNSLVLNDSIFPHWIKDSNNFWYERETMDGKEFRVVNAVEASNKLAFDHEMFANVLARASGRNINQLELPIIVNRIQLLPLQIEFSAFDQHWLFDASDVSCSVVDMFSENELHSPNGKLSAFVRGYNLWVRDLWTGEEQQLTYDGAKEFSYATAPSCYGSPITLAVQAIWSPDSKRLFTHKMDIGCVEVKPYICHVPLDGNVRPQLLEQKIGWSGDKFLESYHLMSIEIETGIVQFVDYDALIVCRVLEGFFSDSGFGWWANDSSRAYFVDLARDAKALHIVEFDVNSGASKVLFSEPSTSFIKLSPSLMDRPVFLPLMATNELIWFSERSGWGHLYLYDMDSGLLKHEITGGDWLVRNVLHFDSERRELWVQTAGRNKGLNPYYRDVCRVNVDSRKITPISSGCCDHIVWGEKSINVYLRKMRRLDSSDVGGISANGEYAVVTRSRVDKVPVTVLLDKAGNEILTLEIADPIGLPASWQWPEPIHLKASDGVTDLYGVIYRPVNFSPEGYYPVLDFSCSHPNYSYLPHSAFTNGPFLGKPYLLGAAYAALGFVVVALETPGKPYRNVAFQHCGYDSIQSASAFNERVPAIRQLAERYHYMDLNRVGLVGCDGISGPVFGLLEYPDFYKVGVSVALEDSRFEAASLVEPFEGLSRSNEDTPYPKDLIESLQGKLLLIHGVMDTSTPVTATFHLIEALRNANKDFDLILLPKASHEFPNYALRRSWDFLVKNLQLIDPPTEFKLVFG